MFAVLNKMVLSLEFVVFHFHFFVRNVFMKVEKYEQCTLALTGNKGWGFCPLNIRPGKQRGSYGLDIKQSYLNICGKQMLCRSFNHKILMKFYTTKN